MIQNEDKIVDSGLCQKILLSLFSVPGKRLVSRLAPFPFGFSLS
jgi:hypothetical protein